jgi:hypothetical protein
MRGVPSRSDKGADEYRTGTGSRSASGGPGSAKWDLSERICRRGIGRTEIARNVPGRNEVRRNGLGQDRLGRARLGGYRLERDRLGEQVPTKRAWAASARAE